MTALEEPVAEPHGAIVPILALAPTFVTPRLPPHVPHVAHSVLYASDMLWSFMRADARVGVGCIVALEVIACVFVVTRGSLRCVALAHVTPHPRECLG